jgi:uncharacterized protein YecT (DUF1311 family)
MIVHFALAMLASAQSQPANCDGTQAEMNECAARDFARAEAELTAEYRAAIDRARASDRDPLGRPEGDDRPGDEATLREAQRGWVAYRDAHCRLEGYSERGGSMESLVYDSCLAELTRARIAQLHPQPSPEE